MLYLTDEHKSFTKLKNKYDLSLFHCFVHLMRSIGSNSLLGYLFSDILYTYSKDEWNKNYLRFFHTFQYLFNLKSDTSDKNRFQKVSSIIGLDETGNPVPINVEYSPIYQRINNNVPTTTNHVENCHKQINIITRDLKNLHLRLAYICKYIVDRCERINESAEDNFWNYLNSLKEKAKKACERGDNID